MNPGSSVSKRGRDDDENTNSFSQVFYKSKFINNLSSVSTPLAFQAVQRTLATQKRSRRKREGRIGPRVFKTPSLLEFLNDFTSKITNKSLHVLHDVVLSVEERLILSLRLNFIPPQVNEPNWSLNDNFLKFQRNVRLKYFFLFDSSMISVDKRDFNNSISENILHSFVNSRKTFEERQLVFTPGKASPDIEEYLSHVENSLAVICQKQNKNSKRYNTKVPQSFFKCLKDLKYKTSKGNLIITEADKNLGTVVMDRSLYELEAPGSNQLRDRNKHTKLIGLPELKPIKAKLL